MQSKYKKKKHFVNDFEKWQASLFKPLHVWTHNKLAGKDLLVCKCVAPYFVFIHPPQQPSLPLDPLCYTTSPHPQQTAFP